MNARRHTGRPGPRRAWVGPLVALATTAVTLGVLEGTLRALGYGTEEPAPEIQRVGTFLEGAQFVPHPERFYALAAHYQDDPDHYGTEARAGWPFRGAPDRPSPPGIATVALFGDSCAFGVLLPHAQTIGESLQRALARDGLDARHVRILNYGVPGYSTVQVRSVVEEVLPRVAIDVAVFYMGSWNDAAPALGRNDVALREHLANRRTRAWWERTALHELLSRARFAERREPRPDVEEILATWQRGDAPPLGPRVPAERFATEVDAILGACERAGVASLVIAPSHPKHQEERTPRVVEDAGTLTRIAHARGVPVLDVSALFDATGEDRRSFFFDGCHPVAKGTRRIADALAPLVRERLPNRAPPESRLAIRAVEPRTLSRLGQQELVVRVDGLAPDDPLPIVTVGGAPLMRVVRTGADRLTGILIENAAGVHDVVVRTTSGVAVAPDAVELVAPQLELVREPARWAIRFHARPGDVAEIRMATRRRARPVPHVASFDHLDPETLLPLPLAIEAGPDGSGTLEIPVPARPPVGELYVQARVWLPTETRVWRWSELLVVSF